MLGGEEVVVAGPCLPPVPPTVTCKVSDVEFAGRVIDDGRIACVLPPLAETGDNVDIMVKVSNGEYYRSVIQISTKLLKCVLPDKVVNQQLSI